MTEPRQDSHVSLREGETRDDTAHARGTIAQLREIEHSEHVGPERQADAAERRRELEAQLEDDDGE